MCDILNNHGDGVNLFPATAKMIETITALIIRCSLFETVYSGRGDHTAAVKPFRTRHKKWRINEGAKWLGCGERSW